MAHRYRRILRQQKDRSRLSHDVATANHHRILSRDRQLAALQDFDDPRRRARNQARLPGLQPAYADRMKAIYVLVGTHCFEQQLGVNLRGQWQLNQDAVDILACIQLVDQGQHL